MKAEEGRLIPRVHGRNDASLGRSVPRETQYADGLQLPDNGGMS